MLLYFLKIMKLLFYNAILDKMVGSEIVKANGIRVFFPQVGPFARILNINYH